jgi:F-type H+-transporting ATPase subunit gamma
MAKTQDLKRRIRSIRNTQQLTRAMKLVSAAKLRRAQQRILQARPFGKRLLALLRSVSAKTDPELHPLLERRPTERIDVIVLTGDKGMCGAFNANILRRAEALAEEHRGAELRMIAVGKRGRDFFTRARRPLVANWVDLFRDVQFAQAAEIAALLMKRYVERETDRVYLVYNAFKSALQPEPTTLALLPIEPPAAADASQSEDYIYEPPAEQLLASLLPHYVELLVFQALLESVAAEHAARMTAMDNATKNAGELIDSLTLTMNRVRQASITTEIIEVVSGAEALG